MALELLTPTEKRELQRLAEQLWSHLQANQLGGYSDGNRPLFILGRFREMIEKFGHRDTGWTWTQAQIDKGTKDGERAAPPPNPSP